MKLSFHSEEAVISLLAAGNLSISGLAEFATKAEPLMHSLMSFGQVLVAVATVFYIIRKAKSIQGPTGLTGPRGPKGSSYRKHKHKQ